MKKPLFACAVSALRAELAVTTRSKNVALDSLAESQRKLADAERRNAELTEALRIIAYPRDMQGDEPWYASIARAALLSAESPR
jgi:hypothetical protein